MDALKALIIESSKAFDASLACFRPIWAGITEVASTGLTCNSINKVPTDAIFTLSLSAGKAVFLAGQAVRTRDLESREASQTAIRITCLTVAPHFITRKANCGVQVVSSSTGGAVEVAVAACTASRALVSLTVYHECSPYIQWGCFTRTSRKDVASLANIAYIITGAFPTRVRAGNTSLANLHIIVWALTPETSKNCKLVLAGTSTAGSLG